SPSPDGLRAGGGAVVNAFARSCGRAVCVGFSALPGSCVCACAAEIFGAAGFEPRATAPAAGFEGAATARIGWGVGRRPTGEVIIDCPPAVGSSLSGLVIGLVVSPVIVAGGAVATGPRTVRSGSLSCAFVAFATGATRSV